MCFTRISYIMAPVTKQAGEGRSTEAEVVGPQDLLTWLSTWLSPDKAKSGIIQTTITLMARQGH